MDAANPAALVRAHAENRQPCATADRASQCVTLALPTRRWLDDGQALAPAQAATFEHCTAGSGKHAFEEAVLPFARDAFGLVGTLGHGGVGPWQNRPKWPGEISSLAVHPEFVEGV
jgi:hypothetical protein